MIHYENRRLNSNQTPLGFLASEDSSILVWEIAEEISLVHNALISLDQ